MNLFLTNYVFHQKLTRDGENFPYKGLSYSEKEPLFDIISQGRCTKSVSQHRNTMIKWKDIYIILVSKY